MSEGGASQVSVPDDMSLPIIEDIERPRAEGTRDLLAQAILAGNEVTLREEAEAALKKQGVAQTKTQRTAKSVRVNAGASTSRNVSSLEIDVSGNRSAIYSDCLEWLCQFSILRCLLLQISRVKDKRPDELKVLHKQLPSSIDEIPDFNFDGIKFSNMVQELRPFVSYSFMSPDGRIMMCQCFVHTSFKWLI